MESWDSENADWKDDDIFEVDFGEWTGALGLTAVGQLNASGILDIAVTSFRVTFGSTVQS